MTSPCKSTLDALIAHAAKAFGDTPALTTAGGETLSFRALDDRAARFASGLADAGVGKGDRVALHLPNGSDWVIAYYGILKLGAVVVPANFLLTAEEVAFLCEDGDVAALIAPPERAKSISSVLDAPPLVTICPGDCDDGLAFDSLLGSDRFSGSDIAPDDLCTIAYTSGTTGKPKGAMLTHRNVFLSTAYTATIHVRQARDVVLTALPFPHVYGNVVMNASLLSGAHLVAMTRFDPGEALALIEREKVTLFEGVPTMYFQMLADPAIDRRNFASLRACTVGGQTMPIAQMEAVVRAFGCPLLELWGMTEVAGPAVSHSPFLPARPGSIGLPFPTMEARVADVEDPARTADPGKRGELLVRGPLVMRGYWRNEAATRETLTEDGWLRTGDIAVIEDDGYLSIVDRKKDMIITAGYNIYPAELERVVASHSAVSIVAVAAVADAEKGEIAKAFIVLKPGATTTEDKILAHCRAQLAAYKVPRLIEFVADLPKTSTGKILRRALRQ